MEEVVGHLNIWRCLHMWQVKELDILVFWGNDLKGQAIISNNEDLKDFSSEELSRRGTF